MLRIPPANAPSRISADRLATVNRTGRVALGSGIAVVVLGLVMLALPAFEGIGDFAAREVAGAAAPATPTDTPADADADADAVSDPTPTPTPTVDDGSGDCPGQEASYQFGMVPGTLSADGIGGERTAQVGNAAAMRDRGARTGARGEVLSDDRGMYAYIVAPNDNLISIDARLCFDMGSLAGFNHVLGDAVQPGQRLILRPDPSIPWIEPYEPYDATVGMSTVDFNSTIYEIGAAVRAHDIDSARALWDRSLSGHLAPDAQDAATQALAAVDWRVLEQMFP